jgi:phage/plasmid-associated DNA primase
MHRKYKGAVERHPHGAALVWASNVEPAFNDPGNAIAGRFLHLTMTQSFKGREKPEIRDTILPAEIAGIFNWALDGCARLAATNQFTKTEAMCEREEETAENANPILQFIDERCTQTTPWRAAPIQDKNALYQAYEVWHRAAGYRHYPLPRNIFFMALRRAFPEGNFNWRRTPQSDRQIRGIWLNDRQGVKPAPVGDATVAAP